MLQKLRGKWLVLVIIGGLLLLCCAMAYLAPEKEKEESAQEPATVAQVADAATPAPEGKAEPAATNLQRATATERPSRTPPPTRTVAPTSPPTMTPGVGNEVRINKVVWVVLSAEDRGQTLKSDNQFVKDQTTSGRFVAVRYRVKNDGTSELIYDAPNLYDKEKRNFGKSSDVYHWIPEEEWCSFEKLNPGITKICQAIYEIPADADVLMAEVSELSLLGKKAMVDLAIGAAK